MTDPIQPPDPTRRRFFRQFAGEVVTSVGSVLGAAQVLQQQSAQAARDLLGPEPGPEAADGGTATQVAVLPHVTVPREIDAATAGFRAAFRWDEDVCWVVDQRRLPDVLIDHEVRGAGDGVSAINEAVIVGSPVQAQFAAVVLALVALRTATHSPFARRATIRGAANAFKNARPASAAMTITVDRMLALLEELGLQVEGDVLVASLRREAEAIVGEATAAHGALVGHLVAALPATPAPRASDASSDATEDPVPLRVLTIGSTGAMGGGQSGTALSALIAAHHAARPIEVLVAETRPGFEGARIAAWELSQAGVAYAVVTDGAAPGAIAAGEVDAVVVGADRIAANGDVVAVAGTYPLALAAHAAGIPFLAAAPTLAVDLETATGADAPLEPARPGRVLAAGGTRVAPEGTRVKSPVQDVTPASLVTAILTERGPIRPPFEFGLSVQVASARPGAAPPSPAPADEPATTPEAYDDSAMPTPSVGEVEA